MYSLFFLLLFWPLLYGAAFVLFVLSTFIEMERVAIEERNYIKNTLRETRIFASKELKEILGKDEVNTELDKRLIKDYKRVIYYCDEAIKALLVNHQYTILERQINLIMEYTDIIHPYYSSLLNNIEPEKLVKPSLKKKIRGQLDLPF